MQNPVGSIAVLILFGCSSSVAWPRLNKFSSDLNHVELEQNVVDTPFFPADETWLQLDRQRRSQGTDEAQDQHNQHNPNHYQYHSINSQHDSDVRVKVWEMVDGQLNLVEEKPVPMQLFRNTSLINGAVVNPQDVPLKVMEMVSTSIEVQHPLLNPEYYSELRTGRNSGNRGQNDGHIGLPKTDKVDQFSSRPTYMMNFHSNDMKSSSDTKNLVRNPFIIENNNKESSIYKSSEKGLDNHMSLDTKKGKQMLPNVRKLLQFSEAEYEKIMFDNFPSETKLSEGKQIIGYVPQESEKLEPRTHSSQNDNKKVMSTYGGIWKYDGAVPHSTDSTESDVQNRQLFIPSTEEIPIAVTPFGGVGNYDYANLPLAIGTALEETDIRYLHTLSQFANQITNNDDTFNTVQSYLRNQNSPFNSVSTDDGTNDNGRNDISNRQDQVNHRGSVLEFLPHDLPHVNPLISSSQALENNPVDLEKVLSTLPTSNTLNREQLRNTLATITGTNTFSGHLGNQGLVNQNNHASQNSFNGNSHQSEVDDTLFTHRQFQPLPTRSDEPYYPFAHQEHTITTTESSFSFSNIAQIPPKNQQSNTRQESSPNSQEFHSQSLIDRQPEYPNSYPNQWPARGPPGASHMSIQRPGTNQIRYPQFSPTLNQQQSFPPAPPSPRPSFGTPQLQGISSYPTPLLDFLFSNISRPSSNSPQNPIISSQQQPQFPGSGSAFNPFDPYIPASDFSILNDQLPSDSDILGNNVEETVPIVPVEAAFTSSTPADCQGNFGCIAGLAGLASAAITKALLLPFLAAGRRKRDTDLENEVDFENPFSQNYKSNLLNMTNLPEKHPILLINANVKAFQGNVNRDSHVNLTEVLDKGQSKSQPIEKLFHSLPQSLQISLMKYALQILQKNRSSYNNASQNT